MSENLRSLKRALARWLPLLPSRDVRMPDLTRGRAAPSADAAFSAGQHSHGGLSRQYKLYTPALASPRRTAPALVVMLHGCGQDPDDFAAGTAMNRWAAEQGFFVLYPAQAGDANPQRCWNWFQRQHQGRSAGEPALIADLTLATIAAHGIDPRRVYIAGLSAGGAMAAIVAACYPEVFAAVGVHSGLAPGSARGLLQAMGAMRSGAAGTGGTGPAVPTIVFHGDQDRTVHPANGEQVVAAALGTAGARSRRSEEQGSGVVDAPHPYTRSLHRDARGRVCAEHWLIHGAGHAWSGGQAGASFVDPDGPDASREMLRFFAEQAAASPPAT